jgi:hypothetical protein
MSAPSIVPGVASEQGVYLVLDDFGGRLGRAWRETDEGRADRATLLRELMEGQYNAPALIVAFNVAEGRCRDVTGEIADELVRLCADRDEVPESTPTSSRTTLTKTNDETAKNRPRRNALLAFAAC